MKKAVAFLLLIYFLCVPVLSFGTEERRIADYADLFNDEEESILASMISEFQIDTAMDFVILTTNTEHAGMTSKEIANFYYDQKEFGMGTDDGGILYYIDMHERVSYISTCGRMIMHMSDERIAAAHEVCHTALSNGKYFLASVQMISVIKAFVYD